MPFEKQLVVVFGCIGGGLADRGWLVRTAGPAGVLDGLCAQDAVVPVGVAASVAVTQAKDVPTKRPPILAAKLSPVPRKCSG